MGWYSDLKNSDWYHATKDIADSIGRQQEQNKFNQTHARQQAALNTVQTTSNPNAVTYDPKLSAQQAQAKGGFLSGGLQKNAVYLAGAVALIVLTVVAIK